MASDDRIKGALLEYLRYHAMTNTLECFEVESQQKLTAAPVSPRSGANTEGMRFRLRRDMMRAFDEGEQERFMTMWAKVS